MKIAVVGIGYVGLSSAVLLAQRYKVVAVDISEERVAKTNARIASVADPEIEDYLTNKELNLSATTDTKEAFPVPNLLSWRPSPAMMNKPMPLIQTLLMP